MRGEFTEARRCGAFGVIVHRKEIRLFTMPRAVATRRLHGCCWNTALVRMPKTRCAYFSTYVSSPCAEASDHEQSELANLQDLTLLSHQGGFIPHNYIHTRDPSPADVAYFREVLKVPAELLVWFSKLQLCLRGPGLVTKYGLAFVSECAVLDEGDLKKAGLLKLEVKRFLRAAAKSGDGAPESQMNFVERESSELIAWLKTLKLSHHHSRLVAEYGLAFVSDCVNLDEEDLKAAGMRKLEVKRFLEAAAKAGNDTMPGEQNTTAADASAELAAWLAELRLSEHGPRLAAEYGLAFVSECTDLNSSELEAAGLRKLEVKRFMEAANTQPARGGEQ